MELYEEISMYRNRTYGQNKQLCICMSACVHLRLMSKNTCTNTWTGIDQLPEELMYV